MRTLPVFVASIGTVTKESSKKEDILYRSSKKLRPPLRHFAQSYGVPDLRVIPSFESQQHIGRSSRMPPKSACNFAFWITVSENFHDAQWLSVREAPFDREQCSLPNFKNETGFVKGSFCEKAKFINQTTSKPIIRWGASGLSFCASCLPISKGGKSRQGRIAFTLTLDGFSWLCYVELFTLRFEKIGRNIHIFVL